ncbi:MAG: hypothetical protein K2F57_02230, partial [Candidatus Gastranaerophilales bacterium]|nr:hypothetical protein [Candidatus Gastranaerophilales bacterium]
ANAMKGMRHGIRKQHPDIAEAADRIGKMCDSFDRTFLPEDEMKFNELFTKTINNEIKKLNKKEVDITPFSLKELGLDKYEYL